LFAEVKQNRFEFEVQNVNETIETFIPLRKLNYQSAIAPMYSWESIF